MSTDKKAYENAKFVDDNPSGEDEFRGQPHDRVASALISILESEGGGGRAIGLEGSWGSGKSTVVQIAQTHLVNRLRDGGPRNSFFVFDAWAHQSDPLRRAFLQELIQHLTADNAVNATDWTEKLKVLETRRRDVTETKAEKLSLVARASFITVPLLPIAYASIVRSTGNVSVNLPWIGTACIPYWVFGAVIVSIPFVAAVYTFLSWREGWAAKRINVFTKRWWSTKRDKRGKSVIWAFTRQTDEVTTTQYIRDEEATTVEFNQIFDELIGDANENNCRIVIVLDNLDRLPAELIRSTWATMRNFFAATPGTERQSTLKNVSLIVPFDRVHIEGVFQTNTGNVEIDATPGFIEKTFEIVLRVSPPILSNWREFLSKKCKSAFDGKLSEQELHQVFTVFDLFCRDRDYPITPRTIKSFVNTVVAQAKQWGNVIPIEHQALYALYKHDIFKNIEVLKDSSLLSEKVEAQLANSEWTKSLAAAHYNVDPNDAIEVLLGLEVSQAINENNHQRLNELRKTSGFYVVLDSCISDVLRGDMDSNYAFNISSILGNIDFDDEVIQCELWRKLTQHVLRISGPIQPTDNTRDGFKQLLEYCPVHEKRAVAKQLTSILSQPNESISKPVGKAGAEWYAHFAIILDAAPPNGAWREILSVRIQKSIPFLFAIAKAGGKGLDFSLCRPGNTPQEIADALAPFIQEEIPNNALEPLIDAFDQNPSCVEWQTVVESIKSRFQTNAPALKGADAYRLFNLLRTIVRNDPNHKADAGVFVELKVDSTLHGVLQLGISENIEDLKDISLYLILVYGDEASGGAGEHPHYGNLAGANNFMGEAQKQPSELVSVEKIAEYASEDGHFNVVMSRSLKGGEESNIYCEMLKELIKRGDYKRLSVIEILKSARRISNIVGDQLMTVLLKRFEDWNISDVFSNDDWKRIDPYFLEVAKAHGPKHYEEIKSFLFDEVQKCTAERWAEELDEEGVFLDLTLKMIELGEEVKLGDSFYDALKDYAEKILNDAEPPKKFAEVWHKLPEHLSKNRRKQFSKWWRDRLIDKAPNSKALVCSFSLFGSSVVGLAELDAKPEDIIRVVVDPLLADDSRDGVQISITFSDTFAKVLAKASKEERQGVSARLARLYESGDVQQQKDVEALADSLMLEFEKPSLSSDEAENDIPSETD